MTDRLIPNWIHGYLAFTDSTISPEEFHLWCAVTTIAGALQRKVWVKFNKFNMYPNMFVVLVSPPGRCGKSSAMDIGKAMLRTIPTIETSADSTSRERLVQDLQQGHKDGQSALTVYSSEFATFFATSQLEMANFLTDIFNSPNEWIHRTKSGGTSTIKNACMNLMACTTPGWLAGGLPFETIGLGFPSRIIFVYQDTPRDRPLLQQDTPEQNVLGELLAQDLKRIHALRGQFAYASDVEDFLNEWYREHQRNETKAADPRIAGYFERKPTHLIKLSMIISAAKRDDLKLTLEDIGQALEMLENTESRLLEVFAGVGRNPHNIDRTEILRLIIKNPEGVTLKDILKNFAYNMTKDEILETLDMLVSTDCVLHQGDRFKPIASSLAQSHSSPAPAQSSGAGTDRSELSSLPDHMDQP